MSQINQLYSAVVNHASSGDNLVIAAVSGSVIKVWDIAITAAGAVNVTIKSGAAGAAVAVSGAYVLSGAGSSLVLDNTGGPRWVMPPGVAFNVSLSGAVAVTGNVWYTLG